MHIEQTSAVSISAPQAVAIRLRVGAEVAARVIEAAGPDGRGLLSLAGAVVRARLPLGLHAGDKLRLHVVGRDGDQLVLRRVAEERPAATGIPASLVAELAESGDGDQLRAALALAGGPIRCPEAACSRSSRTAVTSAPGRERPDEGSVRVVLHTPSLGALELHLTLHGGALDVNVIADPRWRRPRPRPCPSSAAPCGRRRAWRRRSSWPSAAARRRRCRRSFPQARSSALPDPRRRLRRR